MKRPRELLAGITIVILIIGLAPILGLGQAVWTTLTTGTTAALNDVHFPVTNDVGYAVGSGGTIIKTTNGGTTWVAQTSGITATISAVNFADNSRGYAVSQGGDILITVDGGATWIPVAVIPGVLFDVHFPAGGATGYVAGGTAGTAIVLKSTDGGLTWSPVLATVMATHFQAVNFPVSDAVGYVVGPGGVIFKTTDSGTNWTPQTSGTTNDLNDVAFTNNDVGLAVGASGTVLLTADGGTTWIPVTTGATGAMNAVTYVGGVHAYAAEGTGPEAVGSVWHSTDAGVTWTEEVAAAGTSLNGLSFAATTVGYAVGNGGAAAKRSEVTPTPTPTSTPGTPTLTPTPTSTPATPTATPTTPPQPTPTSPAPAPGPGLGNIKGVVFNDLNRNGSRDEGEQPIGGVPLRIESGNWSYSTVSAGDGTYEFCCLTKGTYYIITASVPAGYVNTTVLPLAVSVDGNFWTNQNIGLATAAAPTPVPTAAPAAAPEAPLGLPRTGSPPLAPANNSPLGLGLLLGIGSLAGSLWYQSKRTSLARRR